MSDERELIAEREKKVAEIRALGANPYANGFAPTHTAAEIARASSPAPTPPPAGDGGDGRARRPRCSRTSTSRSPGASSPSAAFGKAAFVKLLDRTGEIQVWVRKDLIGDAAFALWKKVGARRLHRRGRQRRRSRKTGRADHRGRERRRS